MPAAREEMALSFGANAATYDLLRPGYPGAAIDQAIGTAAIEAAVDLGAGTGRLTASLCERGLEVIGISADRPQDFAKMRKMSNSLAYPTATMNQITDNGFGPPEGFPLTYVVDGNGIIRDKFIDVREQLLRDVVLPLLPH